ncbi:T9SS type A sorting domain-containing protein [candidate division WOR-3 bacterium]|nr:T9SS type A sorting domain-containing protein [candidate division WOR-3 bacterium]
MTFLLLISSLSVLADTPDSLVLRYTAEFEQSTLESRAFYELKGGSYPDKEGMPALPSLRKKILTPVGGRVELHYQINEEDRVEVIPDVVHFYGKKEESKKPNTYQPPPAELKQHRPSPYGNATLLIHPFTFDGKYTHIRKIVTIKIYFHGGKWIRPGGYQERNPLLFLNQIRGKRIARKFIPKYKAGLWMKVKTTKEGLYEITPEDISEAGFSPASIDPNRIELRHGYRGVFKWDMDSLNNLDSLPPLIPAIYEINEDGSFTDGERILFFAHLLSGWNRNRFKNNKYFYHNPYTDTNVYWLCLDGEPLLMEEENITGGEDISNFIDTIHLEEDNYSPLKSGLVWGWKELNTTGGQTSALNIPFTIHYPYDNEAIFRIAFYPKNSGQYAFRISLNGTMRHDTVPSTGNATQDRTVFIDTIPALLEGSNQLEITLQTPDESIIMDYVEVIYRKRTLITNGKLIINSDTFAVKHYTISNIGQDPYLLDFSNTEIPFLISHNFTGGSIDFRADALKILLQESPYSIEGISITDPTSLQSGGADWIVISPDEFVSASYKLKGWRNNHLRGISSPVTRVITLKEIYNNFSFGVSDASAIKRFLYHTQSSWNPPISYVLLFGDGSYDNKNLTGIGKTCFIPIHTEGIYIHTGSGYLDKNACWDNWFVDFNEDGNKEPDIPIGRVTASNLTEARDWTDKLTEYESSGGSWRANAILLADDAFGTWKDEKEHTVGAENISNILPDWVYQKKVYLMEYPRVGGEKPEAEEAHLKAMSDGALVAVFLGHGNLRRLTHESVFLLQDITKFKNFRKTPIYYFGSCDVGYFERADEDCIADYSSLYSDGGTIVSIAAGRATGPSSNNALGRRLIQQLFSESVMTAGDAFLLAKQQGGHSTYTFFGDPATAILIDSTELTAELPDTAIGGEGFLITGKTNTSSDRLFCMVTEADYDTTLDAREGTDPIPLDVSITKIGRTLFKGSAPIVNDSFNIRINLPLDIEGQEGNVYLYSRGDKESHLHSFIQFTPGTGTSDTIPPDIGFQIKGKEISKGDLIPPSGEMTIIIRDSSGIDMRSRINLQVKINNSDPIYLIDNFTYHSGNPTKGEASFSYERPFFSDTIRFTVYAKDNAGNIGIRNITFRIGEEKLLWGVDNYPNPMKNKTTIIYHLSEEIDVEIKIYTIAGRLVKNLNPGISRYGVNYADWNGRDERGREVSNGIYYYMVKPGDGDPYYGKIAVIR